MFFALAHIAIAQNYRMPVGSILCRNYQDVFGSPLLWDLVSEGLVNWSGELSLDYKTFRWA